MTRRTIYAIAVMERLIDDRALPHEQLIAELRTQMNELRSCLRAHGINVAPRVPRRKDKAEIIAMARDGMRTSEIARQVSLSRQRVSQILSEADINNGRDQ